MSRWSTKRRCFAILLAVLAAVQVAGAVRFALQLEAALDGDVSAFTDSGCDDCDDESCPQGCPTCHHAPLQLASTPRPALELPLLAPSDAALLSFFPERAPPSRFIAPPDRPPRIAA